jgi:Cdc6-like AAA superfamily ATPase
MAIRGIARDDFLHILHEALSPSGPIQSIEHLFGREAQMREIDKALCSPGRQVFVYGDRGVGKTSLAQTAAFAHQSAETEPLILGCSRNTTFYDLIDTIARKIQGSEPTTKRSSTRSAKIRAVVLEVGVEEKRESPELPKATTFSDAIELLSTLAPRYPPKTLIVIDEFDVLREDEKELFADLIKQLGDQRLPIQFIICGIGESLDNLLALLCQTSQTLDFRVLTP